MDKKKRIVILCESYASMLYPLYRLATDKNNIPVTIFIPTLPDLHQLFQIINEKVYDNKLELIYYPSYAPKWMETKGIKKLLYLLPGILGERRHMKRFYNKYFARLKDADIMFSSPGYSGAKIFCLRRLSRKNTIVFIDPGPPYIGKCSPRSLRDIATLLVYKMIYGKDTQLGQFPSVDPWNKGFPIIHESFMKNAIDSIIDWSNRAEIMESFAWEKFRLFDTGDYKVIYFHQDLVGRYVPDRDKFSQELKDIFDIILRY